MPPLGPNPKPFQTCTNFLGHGSKSKIQDRNVIFGPVKTDLDGPKLIWAGPKQFVLVQNHFGPIEGQGTNQLFTNISNLHITTFLELGAINFIPQILKLSVPLAPLEEF